MSFCPPPSPLPLEKGGEDKGEEVSLGALGDFSVNQLKLGFVLDPPEAIKCLEDTSFYIMKCAFERGHEVYYIDSRDVFAKGDTVLASAQTVEMNFDEGFRTIRKFRLIGLETLDLVFIRKDPPFDAHYLYLTHLLALLKGKVPMLNDPAGIRSANEKLYSLNFPEWIPETAVAGRVEVLADFVDEVGDAVVKPLSERGGTGVVRLRRDDPGKIKTLEESIGKYGTLVAQRFLPDVEEKGDKRILLLAGEILGGYVRIPPRGDFRVSLYHDGRYEKAGFEERERKLVKSLAPKLVADGLLFTGLDVIGGFISEINVTSPAGIPEINHFAGERLEEKVVDFLEGLTARFHTIRAL